MIFSEIEEWCHNKCVKISDNILRANCFIGCRQAVDGLTEYIGEDTCDFTEEEANKAIRILMQDYFAPSQIPLVRGGYIKGYIQFWDRWLD